MGKFIKTALVFIGGMTAGGYCVANTALKSEIFVTALKDTITKKTIKAIYGEEDVQPKRRVSYCDPVRRPRCPIHSLKHWDNIIFETRKDAEVILDTMAYIIKRYGVVSLADVYELAGVNSPSYTATKYGWRSVDDGKVIRCRDGYLIKLPAAEEIK